MNFETLLSGVLDTAPEYYRQAAIITNDNLMVAKSIATKLPNEASNQDIIELLKILTDVQNREKKKYFKEMNQDY